MRFKLFYCLLALPFLLPREGLALAPFSRLPEPEQTLSIVLDQRAPRVRLEQFVRLLLQKGLAQLNQRNSQITVPHRNQEVSAVMKTVQRRVRRKAERLLKPRLPNAADIFGNQLFQFLGHSSKQVKGQWVDQFEYFLFDSVMEIQLFQDGRHASRWPYFHRALPEKLAPPLRAVKEIDFGAQMVKAYSLLEKLGLGDTPLVLNATQSETLSEKVNWPVEVFLKPEYLMPGLSFKPRLAAQLFDFFDSETLEPDPQKSRNLQAISAASTGNQAISVITLVKTLRRLWPEQFAHLRAIVYTSKEINGEKMEAIRREGAELGSFFTLKTTASSGKDLAGYLPALYFAREEARESQGALKHIEHEDSLGILGYSTALLETLRDLGILRTSTDTEGKIHFQVNLARRQKKILAIVPVGSGGYGSGWIKAARAIQQKFDLEIYLLGVQTFESPALFVALKEGAIRESRPLPLKEHTLRVDGIGVGQVFQEAIESFRVGSLGVALVSDAQADAAWVDLTERSKGVLRADPKHRMGHDGYLRDPERGNVIELGSAVRIHAEVSGALSHAFLLFYEPYLLDLIRDNKIDTIVCPISGQRISKKLKEQFLAEPPQAAPSQMPEWVWSDPADPLNRGIALPLIQKIKEEEPVPLLYDNSV